MYCIKNYENVALDEKEFREDLERIKYLRKLFKRYKAKKVLKERLILNHLVILFNVFNHDAAVKILFFGVEKEYWSSLKTFLLFLNYMPDKIDGISDLPLLSSEIPIDLYIVNRLKNI
jgi:hypothetical protein